MAQSTADDVPRTPDDPSPEAVLAAMEVCEPYTVGDLTEQFDASRWTIQRRLETLHDQNKIRKKKHSENRVSWWIWSE